MVYEKCITQTIKDKIMKYMACGKLKWLYIMS